MTAYILNLFDLFCTLYALRLGAVELNPFMQSVPVMAAYKIFIVGGLVWWLSHRPEPLAKKGLIVTAAFYAAVVVNNLFIIALILSEA